MIYNVTANVVNIVFNYLLINGHFGFPAWGVAGASIATVLGQAVALVMAIRTANSGKYYFTIKPSDFLHGFRFDEALHLHRLVGGGHDFFARGGGFDEHLLALHFKARGKEDGGNAGAQFSVLCGAGGGARAHSEYAGGSQQRERAGDFLVFHDAIPSLVKSVRLQMVNA